MKKNEPRRIQQTVTPRAKRRATRSHRQRRKFNFRIRDASLLAKPLLIIALMITAVLGYNALANSAAFELKNVKVVSASPLLAAEVEQTVRRAVGQSRLLSVDLASLRQKIEAMPRVRSATVARSLPDGIYINVAERRATVLVRRATNSILWLDEDASELGDVSDFKPEESRDMPPILSGFAEGNRSVAAVADDRDRIAAYRQIEREMNTGPDSLWKYIGEIDLKIPKDVNIRIANTIVSVHVGSKDFHNRFKTALDVLAAAKRGDRELLSRYSGSNADKLTREAEYINFIDAASKSGKIVFGFATPGANRNLQETRDPKQDPRKKDQKQEKNKPT